MKKVSLDPASEPITVSNSRIKSWRRCRRLHHYKYNEKIERIKPKATLLKGRIIHELIEAYIAGEDWKEVLAGYEEEYNKLFQEEKEEFGNIIENMETIMNNYISYWEKQPIKYLSHQGKNAEFDFTIPLVEGMINLTGKIDAVAKDKNGRVWIVERKTFGKGIPSEDLRFSDIQTVIYYKAAQEIGFPQPNGVLWDYIKSKPPTKPQLLKSGELSKKKKIDSTTDTYLQAIKDQGLNPEDYEDILEELEGKEDKFLRRIYLPSPDQIAEIIMAELIQTAKEIYFLGDISKARSLGWDCDPGRCDYYNLCYAELHGLDTDYLKKKEYKQRGEDNDEEKEELE